MDLPFLLWFLVSTCTTYLPTTTCLVLPPTTVLPPPACAPAVFTLVLPAALLDNRSGLDHLRFLPHRSAFVPFHDFCLPATEHLHCRHRLRLLGFTVLYFVRFKPFHCTGSAYFLHRFCFHATVLPAAFRYRSGSAGSTAVPTSAYHTTTCLCLLDYLRLLQITCRYCLPFCHRLPVLPAICLDSTCLLDSPPTCSAPTAVLPVYRCVTWIPAPALPAPLPGSACVLDFLACMHHHTRMRFYLPAACATAGLLLGSCVLPDAFLPRVYRHREPATVTAYHRSCCRLRFVPAPPFTYRFYRFTYRLRLPAPPPPGCVPGFYRSVSYVYRPFYRLRDAFLVLPDYYLLRFTCTCFPATSTSPPFYAYHRSAYLPLPPFHRFVLPAVTFRYLPATFALITYHRFVVLPAYHLLYLLGLRFTPPPAATILFTVRLPAVLPFFAFLHHRCGSCTVLHCYTCRSFSFCLRSFCHLPAPPPFCVSTVRCRYYRYRSATGLPVHAVFVLPAPAPYAVTATAVLPFVAATLCRFWITCFTVRYWILLPSATTFCSCLHHHLPSVSGSPVLDSTCAPPPFCTACRFCVTVFVLGFVHLPAPFRRFHLLPRTL